MTEAIEKQSEACSGVFGTAFVFCPFKGVLKIPKAFRAWQIPLFNDI